MSGIVRRLMGVAKGDDVDPFFQEVSLLIDGDGQSGSTNIVDHSLNSFPLTVGGDTQINTTIKKFGSGSVKFDGNGDFISVPSSQAFVYGTGNFTIEAWVYFDSGSLSTIRTVVRLRRNAATTWNLQWNAPNQIMRFYFGRSWITDSSPVQENTWYFFTAVKNNGVISLFRDGQVVGSANNNFNYSTQDTVLVGCGGDTNDLAFSFDGYIDDLRITKGLARYTSNFTPPEKAFPKK
jgi:hypothetical protein